LGFDIQFIEFEVGHSISANGLYVQAYEVLHSPESQPHAIKIKYKNKVLAFSGDSEWTDVLIEVAEGADLFICECNFYSRKGKAHLDYNTLLAHQRELNCKRLILNHLGEEMLENTSNISMECAEDGSIYYV
jgi:ribonuclease BN (tRNA processing enzyme)